MTRKPLERLDFFYHINWGQSCIWESSRDKTQCSELNGLRVLYRPDVGPFMCEIPDYRSAFGCPSPVLCLSHILFLKPPSLKLNLHLMENWLIDHINGRSWWIQLTLPIPTVVLGWWFGALCGSGSMAMFGLSGAVFRSLTGSVLYVVLQWLIWERAHTSKDLKWKFCSQKVTSQTVSSLQVLLVDRTWFEWPRVNEHSWILEQVWHPPSEHRIKVSVLLELSLTNTNTCLLRDTCFWLWVFTSGCFSPGEHIHLAHHFIL